MLNPRGIAGLIADEMLIIVVNVAALRERDQSRCLSYLARQKRCIELRETGELRCHVECLGIVQAMPSQSLVLSIAISPVKREPVVRGIVGPIVDVFGVPRPEIVTEFELIVEVSPQCRQVRVPTLVGLSLEAGKYWRRFNTSPIA